MGGTIISFTKPKSARTILRESFALLPHVVIPGLLLIALIVLLNVPLSIYKYTKVFCMVLFTPGCLLWLNSLCYEYIEHGRISYQTTLITVVKKYLKIIIPLMFCYLLFGLSVVLNVMLCGAVGVFSVGMSLLIKIMLYTIMLLPVALLFASAFIYFIFYLIYMLEVLFNNATMLAALKKAYAIAKRGESIKRAIYYMTLLGGVGMLGCLVGVIVVLDVKYFITAIWSLAKLKTIMPYVINSVMLLFVGVFVVLRAIAEIYFYKDLVVRYTNSVKQS